MKKKLIIVFFILVAILVLVSTIGYYYLGWFHAVYYNDDFGISDIVSPYDHDEDEIDDFKDILLGAREDALNRPKYKSAYYAGGYPPEDEGVCTDLVWRSFKKAGYSLKNLVDVDISDNIHLYPRVNGKADPNIDFRRVANLKVFFERNATNLTLDYKDIAAWQGGDIVIFGNNHIAIVSDKRNKDGIAYIIHNAGQYNREEDALVRWHKNNNITGHYRFDKDEYIKNIKD